MSRDWFQDIKDMHDHYGIREKVNALDDDKLKKFLKFRVDCLTEEYNETLEALYTEDAEEFVDALIDYMVFAIGTLDLFGVDAHKAWDEVLHANLNKEVGIKANRPNPFGLPDLLKNSGWVAPNHSDNHGKIESSIKRDE